MLFDKREGLHHVFFEDVFVHNGLVGGHHQQAGLWANTCDAMGCPCHTGCRVAIDRLGHDVIWCHFGQLLFYQMAIAFVCVDVDIGLWKHPLHAVIGLLKLRLSCAKEINKLLRMVLTAARPQPSSFPSCEDNAEVMFAIYGWCH